MSGAIDNCELVAWYVPEEFDGDTFVYTELLNRQRKSGNNKGRLVRTFYHRSREEFDQQLPDIRALCDYTGARAYTRLSTRSFKKVGQKYAAHVLEQAFAENWEGIRHGYSHACGVSAPLVKYWQFDVDDPAQLPLAELAIDALAERRGEQTPRQHTIPSLKGYHIITRPFDPRGLTVPNGVELKRDANTNLYIPAGA